MMFATKVMGHRGAAKIAPENTLASLKAAADAGLKWVEIDVSLAGGDDLVIFHDDTLDRCTSGSGLVIETSVTQLKKLDAGSWFDTQFANETVPTLVEALLYIQELGLSLNLEIKYSGEQIERIVPAVMAQIHTYWQDKSSLMISSFNEAALVMVRELDGDVRLGQLYDDIPANWSQTLKNISAFSLNCNHNHLTEEQATAIKKAGYYLFCYTANDPKLVESHWHWGMDTIITDDPSVFIDLGFAT
ncbi:glycerophosphoryl diester phosphodiesterase [Marinomonas agarivorans]|nr:glycerophosphoryl diester phosphodiesterase [Marinomonas agarivorans]